MDLDPRSEEWRLGALQLSNQPMPLPIGYAGPPGTFEPISFSRLLAPKALKDPAVKDLKDKVVIIGSTHQGAQDRHLTPYGKRELMFGAEVQANIVQTLLTGRFPVGVSWILGILAVLVLVAFGTYAFFRLSPAWGAVVAVVLAGLYCVLAFLMFLGDMDLPVGPGHLTLALCYLGTIGLRLTGEERRRLRLRRMFGQYVSDEVVEKLLSSGRRPDLGGEMVTATVLFSDIRNFTTIAERLSAHEVVEMLNTYFGRVCDAIFAEGGTVDKFVGDAIMAVFGSPVPHPDHARRALRAAVSMDRIATGFRGWLTDRFAGRNLPEFDIGIGIHTGDAVIGNIGSPKRLEFTAIGDTVNTAARLEGLTKQLGARILISASTVAAAGSGLTLGKQHRIQVKGREEEVEVVEFRGLEEDDGGSRVPTE
jgi:adenylate cyclase